MSVLREVRIADVAQMKYGKIPPKGMLAEEGYPVFSGYRVTGRTKEYLYADSKLVVVARGVGGTGDVKISPPQSWITNLSIVLELDNDTVNQRYLYYKLLREPLKEKLNTGAAQAQITINSLKSYRIRIHEISAQERIADILSAYDDLIENNRRRIELLERAAREIYREWFVRLRFPGHERAKIVDGMPAGWARRKVSDICDMVGGGTPSTKIAEYWGGDVKWVVPTDVTKNDCLVLLDSARKITDKGLRKSSAKIVPAETILMTSRASVGFFALMDCEFCTNQGFINIIPVDKKIRMYLLFNLISRVAEIRSNAKGTTYPEISKGLFSKMDIVVPAKPLVMGFANIASDVVRQVRCLKRSTLRLSQARDLLLPRLMSGEVEV